MPGVANSQNIGARAKVCLATVRAGGWSIFLGAMIALVAFTVPVETRAQSGNKPAAGSGAADKEKAKIDPKDLYGDQGGEKVLEGNARLPNAVMRARLEDTFYKLSNPRIGQTTGPGPKRPAILIDYEVVSKGKLNGGTLVLRADDGSRAEIALNLIAGRDDGIIQLVASKEFGNLKVPKNVMFPENIEVYVTRGDDRYDPPLKCLVSNAAVMGKMKTSTRARDWTAEEIARYTKGPPAYKNPNAYPDLGEDVPALPKGRFGNNRYVDPTDPLLGLDYMAAKWKNEPSVWRLAPVFSADQPKQHRERSIAKKGYAVCGADLNVDKFVNGIRLHFCRVKADGTLDTKDTYAGAWIGAPPANGEGTKLVNDGRRVLGVYIQSGAIVDRFALVAEEKTK